MVPTNENKVKIHGIVESVCGSPFFLIPILFFRMGVREHLVLVKNSEYGVLGLIAQVKFVFPKEKPARTVFL